MLTLNAVATINDPEIFIADDRFFVPSVELWNRYTVMHLVWAMELSHNKHHIAFIEYDGVQSIPSGVSGFSRDLAIGSFNSDIIFDPIRKPFPKRIRIVMDQLNNDTHAVTSRTGIDMELTYA